jgi:hypothetical protein
MAYNLLRGDRDQPLLLPRTCATGSPRIISPGSILDVVDQLDLQPFYGQHRDDGHGHPAYDPRLLLGVLLYGYCLGCAPPGRSNAAAMRTSPSGSLPPIRPPIT